MIESYDAYYGILWPRQGNFHGNISNNCEVYESLQVDIDVELNSTFEYFVVNDRRHNNLYLLY